MSSPSKNQKTPVKRSPLGRVVRGLYIILVAVSLVVIVSFIALKIFAPAPDVPDQVEFELDPDMPGLSDSVGDNPSTVRFNRREGVYTCLLLGVADQGGSDTIMLGVFDTEAKTASLVSVPRDTAVMYNGKQVKINATYTYGGAEAVADSVSKLLAVPIDFYVSVDVRAFREIVDEIGGVYFDVPVLMNYDDPKANLSIHIQPGYQLLDGKKAEGVVRCRNCYANADIGRAATQRAFLTALAKQTITLSNVTKVTSLINILNTYVESDMLLNNMVYFGTQAVGMDLDTGLNSAALPGIWPSVQDPYYYLYADETLSLVNSLGIYKEEVPAKVLQIITRGS